MKKPVLVIMAAGMGSRYGGLKQIDPIDEQGHIIVDFSIYDAVQAGFEKIVFVIKKEIEEDFKKVIGERLKDKVEISYAYQELDQIPEGFSVPEGRKKPWGTAHAVYSCANEVDGPFAVINADDFYGRDAFCKIYDFLVSHEDNDKYQYAMVGYQLKNTLTENGHVARGVCSVDSDSKLLRVVERTHIERREEGICYTEDDGKTWGCLPENAVVSMNLWGFTNSFMGAIKEGIHSFFERGLQENPMKCEYFLPAVVTQLLEEERATVTVLPSDAKWYGVTYKADKPVVVKAIQEMKNNGIYPKHLWEE